MKKGRKGSGRERDGGVFRYFTETNKDPNFPVTYSLPVNTPVSLLVSFRN